jgi:hypothetical protein
MDVDYFGRDFISGIYLFCRKQKFGWINVRRGGGLSPDNASGIRRKPF